MLHSHLTLQKRLSGSLRSSRSLPSCRRYLPFLDGSIREEEAVDPSTAREGMTFPWPGTSMQCTFIFSNYRNSYKGMKQILSLQRESNMAL